MDKWLEKVVIGLFCLTIGLFAGWYMRDRTQFNVARMNIPDKTTQGYYKAYRDAAVRTQVNTERQMGRQFEKGDYVFNTYWFLVEKLKHPCSMPDTAVEKLTNQIMLLSFESIRGTQEQAQKKKEGGGK